MLRFIRTDVCFIGVTALLAATGCGSEHAAKQTATARPEQHADHEGGDHEHAEFGPHGGQLIELGKEEFHAELLHDDEKHTVTIYVLDAKAENTVPISAPDVMIQVESEGAPRRFTLAAVRLDQDGPAESFCFEAVDDVLSHLLDAEGATATLTIDIKGREFTGAIVHEHEHEHEHQHSNEEHGGHRHE